jgi:hypothetical protein
VKLLLAALLMLLPGASPPATIIMSAAVGERAPDIVNGQPGNPFATALIEILSEGRMPLAEWGPRLQARTHEISGGFQSPEVVRADADGSLRLAAAVPGERRVALVIIHSAYTHGWPPLPGAAHDARRLPAAFRAAGFDTQVLVDPSRGDREAALARFAQSSARADVAILYSTGHGMMFGNEGYLLDSDYVLGSREERLADRAIALSRMVEALRSPRANLFLFGGCRSYEWLA